MSTMQPLREEREELLPHIEAIRPLLGSRLVAQTRRPEHEREAHPREAGPLAPLPSAPSSRAGARIASLIPATAVTPIGRRTS